MQWGDIIIRPITSAEDAAMAAIIRSNLEYYHLNIPGTAYFDPELAHLSEYYQQKPEQRAYMVLLNADKMVLGGVGIAEYPGMAQCAELQKLYLSDIVKGRGFGKRLMQVAEQCAKERGYKYLYLETHSSLETAIHLYQKMGFESISKPDGATHSAMDCFYCKELE